MGHYLILHAWSQIIAYSRVLTGGANYHQSLGLPHGKFR